MSIRWIRNVLVEGNKTTLEILLGSKIIADKCYVRVNGGQEVWFTPQSSHRDSILSQGVQILKGKLQGKEIKNPQGMTFDWN